MTPEPLTDAARRIAAKLLGAPLRGETATTIFSGILATELPLLIAAHALKPTLDVAAVAREITTEIPSWYLSADSGMLYDEKLREILTRHVTDAPAWVRIPETTTVGELSLPAAGTRYLWQSRDGKWNLGSQAINSSMPFQATVSGYRIVADDGTTGPLIERQSTTTRIWTAEACAPCVGAWRVVTDGMTYSNTRTADQWAAEFNGDRVTMYCIVPEPTHD